MTIGPHDDALRAHWTLEGTIPLSGVPAGASWHRARSAASGESVVLLLVQGPAALEVADAARRAFLVEDPRLIPVREVRVFGDPREDPRAAAPGAPAPVTAVEYPVPPAPPLAAMYADGPLRAETARSVIGETAAGLDTARRRGIRHQHLDSNRVFVDPAAGTVHVLGAGVEAAAALETTAEQDTGFRDTAALVALLYKALTGSRPVRGQDGLVPRASRVSPRQVPDDLDVLCDLVLNQSGDAMPVTVRDLVTELSPWQSIPVTLEAFDADDAAAAAAGTSANPEAGPRADVAAGQSAADGGAPAGAPAAAVAVPTPGIAAGPAPGASAAPEPAPPVADPVASPVAPSPSAPASGSAPGSGSASDPSAPAPAQSAGSASEPVQDAPAAPGSSDSGSSAGGADHAAQVDRARTSEEAQTLIRELHLDEPRRGAAFPGNLDLAAAPAASALGASAPHGTAPEGAAPDEAAAPDGSSAGADLSAPAGAATAAAAAYAYGGPAETAPAGSAGSPSGAEGSHPGADAASSESPGTATAALASTAAMSPVPAPSPTPSPSPAPAPVPAASAAAPGRTAAAPSGPVPASASAPADPEQRTAPMAPVAGAAAPAVHVGQDALSTPPESPQQENAEPSTDQVPTPQTGPIVVRGRDTSLAEEPTEIRPASGPGSLLRDVVGVAMDRDEAVTYAQTPVPRDQRSRTAQWVLVLAVLGVIVALVFAVTSITSTLRGDTNPVGEATTSAAAEETSAAAEETAAPETTPEALPVVTLASAELFTRGTDREPDHLDRQDRLTDGDPSSAWSSQIYRSAQYGNLKEGLGVRLSFEQPGTLNSVVVTTAENSGGVLELRADPGNGELGEVLATGEFAGDGDVTLTPQAPLPEASSVVLWIPELPGDAGGDGFRARIAEVRVQ